MWMPALPSRSSRRSAARALRRQAHDGEVGRAAADVGDQHQLLAAQGALVVQRGADRLELEADLAKAHLARDGLECVLGLAVGGLVLIDEVHRAAEHRVVEGAPGRALGARLELADEAREQLAKPERAPIHLGLAIDQAGAEQALERAHQPPFVALQVFGERSAPVVDRVLVGVEEHRRRQRRPAVLERDEDGRVEAQPADGGVGGAEVDAAGAGRLVHGVARGTGRARRAQTERRRLCVPSAPDASARRAHPRGRQARRSPALAPLRANIVPTHHTNRTS